MPNILDANGLQTQTQTELLAYFTTQYQTIYGASIDLDSNTPDGQFIGILIQTIQDLLDFQAQGYNSFDPDNAIGVVLDQRCAINGVVRQGGTYSVTPVTVVTSQSVNLYGLDQTVQSIYTVSDGSGNNWLLETTQIGIGPGTNSFNFRAAQPGNVLAIPNNINVPVTILPGVSSVNNPTSYIVLGQAEESDGALRLRRQQSVALASQGYYNSLLSQLENIPNVSAAFIYENTSDTTDSNDVPGHSIWVIVGGSATPVSIATAIYDKRNAGCGMKGSQTYNIIQADGSVFTVQWDDVVTRNIFVTFEAVPINNAINPNIAAIRPGLVTNLVTTVAGDVNVNEIATIVQQIDPNTLVLFTGISDGTSQTITLNFAPTQGTFYFQYGSVVSAVINWNDSISTIQTKLQAMSGLATATVTGSLASRSLVFDFSTLTDVTNLIYIPITGSNASTLMDTPSFVVNFSYDANYQNLLVPSSKQDQFVLQAPNVYITTMYFANFPAKVSSGATIQFVALGGYGPYYYFMESTESGGTVSTSGLYTAGSSSGFDLIKVFDALGNSAQASVTVV